MAISKHCKIAVFDNMIVALDLKRSRYFLYNKTCAIAFAERYLDERKIVGSRSLEPLIADGVVIAESLQPSLERLSISDYRAMRFETFDTGAWESRTLAERKFADFAARPFFRIIKAALLLKIFGLGALSALERLRLRPAEAVESTAADPAGIIEQHLSASLWSPFQITCLPFAFSLVTSLRKSNIPAQLVIGVRPIPFVAHAWIEIDGQVYGDVPELRKSYGEIYRTPQHDDAR